MTSVLIVDDHKLFRIGVAELLRDNGLQVVGEAANGNEAVHMAEKFRPDVILMDLHMPGADGIQATRQLASRFPILILTVSDSDEDLSKAIRAGAAGYVLKHIEPADLLKAITKIVEGIDVLSPEMAGAALKVVRRQSQAQGSALSQRETEVLGLISKGRSNVEIGHALNISEHTVKTYVERIFDKLNVRSRSEAAAIAGSLGLS